MTEINDERTLNSYARLGGFMYLFVIGIYIAGDFLMGSFHVAGDFAQTAANIRAAEPLYRSSIALQLIASITTILLGGAFYVLLRPVDRNLALFALLWRVVETVIGGVAVIFRLMALNVYLGGARIFTLDEQQAMASAIAHGSRAGFPIATAYFSVGSILFFYLLLKSRFIPRALAAFGLVASVIVTLMSFASLIVPEGAAAMQLLFAPIFVAEIVAGLWLMIRGADFTWWNARAGKAPTS